MLRLSDKPLEWAKFTLVIAILLTVATWYVSHAYSLFKLYPILLSVIILTVVIAAFINPTPFKPFYCMGMKVSYFIGQVISRMMLVLFFLLLPFYNSWMISESGGSSSNDNNAQFHFESWNEGTSDSNITSD